MPRKRNDLSTVPVTLSTTPQVVSYLKQLLKTGLYGKNTAEAAERVLAQTLEGLLRRGRIRPPKGA
jgi:hypothetical protein